MENWDQEKLEMVVKKKFEGGTQTEIVCKFFLEAVEGKKYGWFWECPNGSSCMYRYRAISSLSFPLFLVENTSKKQRLTRRPTDTPFLRDSS